MVQIRGFHYGLYLDPSQRRLHVLMEVLWQLRHEPPHRWQQRQHVVTERRGLAIRAAATPPEQSLQLTR